MTPPSSPLFPTLCHSPSELSPPLSPDAPDDLQNGELENLRKRVRELESELEMAQRTIKRLREMQDDGANALASPPQPDCG